MSIEKVRQIMIGVLVDSDGEVILDVDELDWKGAICFSLNGIKQIHQAAVAHKCAYRGYELRGFEDEEKYRTDFDYMVNK